MLFVNRRQLYSTVFVMLTVFVIPELWLDYFSYPNVETRIACKMNGGNWNENYNDCEGIFEICESIGGIKIAGKTDPDSGLFRISCKFE